MFLNISQDLQEKPVLEYNKFITSRIGKFNGAMFQEILLPASGPMIPYHLSPIMGEASLETYPH